MASYTLYGSPVSLFTGKARSYLRYKGIQFDEVLSSYSIYKKIIIPHTGVRFIPVVKTPEHQYLQDTSVIIDALEQQFPTRSVLPSSPKQLLVAKLLEWYGDDWLVIPAMHYRWNKNQEHYIYTAFGQTAFPRWPAFMQRWIGKKLGDKFRGYVELLGITEKTIPDIESWYEGDFLVQLNEHFAQHRFLLGDRACVGDFGLMGPLYAHLYLDPYPGKIMKKIAPNVVQWIERMNATAPEVGQWLPDDEIPETLMPILERLFSEFFPVMNNMAKTVSEWKNHHPNETIPRMIGKHTMRIGASEADIIIRPFSQWKLQRVLAVLPTDNNELMAVKALLNKVQGTSLLETTITSPVMIKNNQLVWQ